MYACMNLKWLWSLDEKVGGILEKIKKILKPVNVIHLLKAGPGPEANWSGPGPGPGPA